MELKNSDKANQIFKELIEQGDKTLNNDAANNRDFFAIFGGKQDKNTRNSQAYTLRGLGYKGLGELPKAKEDLTKAVNLSVSNLWANTELQNLQF